MVLKLCVFFAFLLLLGCSSKFEDNPSDINNFSPPKGIAYGTFVDPRDGTAYRTVAIGEQIWMAENLNYNTTGSKCATNTGYHYVYLGEEEGYCYIYGRLYPSSMASEVCPFGWRLPNDSEWAALINYAGNDSAATKLRAARGWSTQNNGTQGTDDYGFSALPGGYGSSSYVDNFGRGSYWWSATAARYSNYTYRWSISNEYSNGKYKYTMKKDSVGGYSYSSGYFFSSVRCIQDERCNSAAYNTATHFCFNETLYPLCGGYKYNLTNQRCGEDDIIETKCGNAWYDNTTHFCVENTVYQLCGYYSYYRKSYDPANQRCGENYTVETKCGNGWYEETNSNYKCEDNVVKMRCESLWYNTETHFCYGSETYELCNGDSYYPYDQKCEDNTVKGRCGTVLYNVKTHFCSSSNLYELCNGKEFNPASQKCGADNIVVTQCGTDWYDATNYELRCSGQIVQTRCGTNYWYDAKTQRCGEGNVIETKCGADWYNAGNSNLKCEENIVKTQCGNNWYDAKTQRCDIGNVVQGKCGNVWYDAENQVCESGIVQTKCGEGSYNEATHVCLGGASCLIEERGVDGPAGSFEYGEKTYNAVRIGCQIWMKENLDYNAIGSKCYGNSESNCDIYGRLYDWETANTVCPSGWHLPSNEEWNALVSYVGGRAIAGTKLKANGWYTGGYPASTNNYGFSAKPGGLCSSDGGFSGVEYFGFWWSSSEYDSDRAFQRDMGYPEYIGDDFRDKTLLLSIRCVQD